MKFKGTMCNWNDAKGFGFIQPLGHKDRIFVHISAFGAGAKRPCDGDKLEFQAQQQNDGRWKASHAHLEGAPVHTRRRGEKRLFTSLFCILFCLALALLIYFAWLPIELAYLYLAASGLSIIFYAVDKSAAQKQRWRTKESTLHLLALVGGWPGAFYAQQRFRHKTSKQSFQIGFWLTVLINLLACLWLLSDKGQRWLDLSVFS